MILSCQADYSPEVGRFLTLHNLLHFLKALMLICNYFPPLIEIGDVSDTFAFTGHSKKCKRVMNGWQRCQGQKLDLSYLSWVFLSSLSQCDNQNFEGDFRWENYRNQRSQKFFSCFVENCTASAFALCKLCTIERGADTTDRFMPS